MHSTDAPLRIRELKPVLKEREVAEEFDVPRKTLQRWRYKGMLEGVFTVLSRHVFYDTAKFLKFLFSTEDHNAS